LIEREEKTQVADLGSVVLLTWAAMVPIWGLCGCSRGGKVEALCVGKRGERRGRMRGGEVVLFEGYEVIGNMITDYIRFFNHQNYCTILQ
jgi:hypothetical protein